MIGIIAIVNKKWGGVYQYTLSLVESLTRYGNKSYEYLIFRSVDFPKGFSKYEIEVSTQNSAFLLKILRVIYVNTGFKLVDIAGPYRIPKGLDVELVISPVFGLMPLYIGKPYIITIHDFQHKYYPNFFSWKDRLAREYLYRNTIKESTMNNLESIGYDE